MSTVGSPTLRMLDALEGRSYLAERALCWALKLKRDDARTRVIRPALQRGLIEQQRGVYGQREDAYRLTPVGLKVRCDAHRAKRRVVKRSHARPHATKSAESVAAEIVRRRRAVLAPLAFGPKRFSEVTAMSGLTRGQTDYAVQCVVDMGFAQKPYHGVVALTALGADWIATHCPDVLAQEPPLDEDEPEVASNVAQPPNGKPAMLPLPLAPPPQLCPILTDRERSAHLEAMEAEREVVAEMQSRRLARVVAKAAEVELRQARLAWIAAGGRAAWRDSLQRDVRHQGAA